MNTEEIIKALRDMAKYSTVTLPRDCEALKAAADLLAQRSESSGEPAAWVGLTDDEIWEIAERSEDNRFSFARAIEAAHGIKEINT